MPTNWMNNDGLYIRFGSNEATAGRAGEYNVGGPLHWVEATVNLVDLPTATELILSDTVTIPNGSRIEKVTISVQTAATSGGSATLDIGLIDQDRVTELDYNGFVADLALADMSDLGALIEFMNGADSTPAGETTDGALVGTTLTNTGYLTASASTAVFTAGVIVVRVYFYKP